MTQPPTKSGCVISLPKKMSINSLVLCNVGREGIQAYPEFVTREGCLEEHVMMTCDGIPVHFNVDAFLDLGINFTPYVRQRLLEALSCPNIGHINTVSRRSIMLLEEHDPSRLERWRMKEGFDPNYISFDAGKNIVYAKGTDIEIIMNSCIQITPTMWLHMHHSDKIFAQSHPNFEIVTSEWSALFRRSL